MLRLAMVALMAITFTTTSDAQIFKRIKGKLFHCTSKVCTSAHHASVCCKPVHPPVCLPPGHPPVKPGDCIPPGHPPVPGYCPCLTTGPVVYRQPTYGPNPGSMVIVTSTECEAERSAWSAADAELQNSITERDAAEVAVSEAEAAVAEAQAVLAAAEASLASANATYEAANEQVGQDTATAAGAYGEWLDCVTGSEDPGPSSSGAK